MIRNPAMPWKDEWRKDLPKTAEMEPTSEPMTSWITYLDVGIEPKVRDVIEKLEPGIHQYHPCIVQDNGKRFDYLTLKVNASVGDDAVIKEKTKTAFMAETYADGWRPELMKMPHIVFKRESIAGKHLFYYRYKLVISNALHEQLDRSALLTGIDLVCCREE